MLAAAPVAFARGVGRPPTCVITLTELGRNKCGHVARRALTVLVDAIRLWQCAQRPHARCRNWKAAGAAGLTIEARCCRRLLRKRRRNSFARRAAVQMKAAARLGAAILRWLIMARPGRYRSPRSRTRCCAAKAYEATGRSNACSYRPQDAGGREAIAAANQFADRAGRSARGREWTALVISRTSGFADATAGATGRFAARTQASTRR